MLGARSIQGKLIAILMLTSVAALLCACLAFAIFEVRSYRAALTREMESVAQIVGSSSHAALLFHDVKTVRETLSVLQAEPRILAGCIYRDDATLVGQFRGGGSDYMRLTRPIQMDGQWLGSVHLVSGLNEMYARLARFGGIALAVLAGSVLLALLLSSVLQKVISRPILHLAETAGRVSTDRDYSVRAAKFADDEIGVLVDRFNFMLEEIHAQDDALRQAQDETEARVVERTRELETEISVRKNAQAELETARDLAEEANRAKSAFLANMSHELRTPLNAIIGYSEMLMEEGHERGDVWPDQDLERIRGAGQHLLTLINDVLDISKIEAGRMDVTIEPLGVRDIIDDVLGSVEPLARRNGNRLSAECRTAIAEMPADLMKFRQSLLNLLSNACKFTENGTVSLEVTDFEEDGRLWLRWTVRDTGIGIDPAQADKSPTASAG
jgi:signal transduction histidine kinase